MLAVEIFLYHKYFYVRWYRVHTRLITSDSFSDPNQRRIAHCTGGGDGDGVEQASSFITLHVQAQVCYFLQLSKYEATRGDRTSLKQMSTRQKQFKINGI